MATAVLKKTGFRNTFFQWCDNRSSSGIRITLDGLAKSYNLCYSVIPVKTGISYSDTSWIPAFAGMTDLPTFYEIINYLFFTCPLLLPCQWMACTL
jgi:hypothetical protein